MQIQSTDDLFAYLVSQATSGDKAWFGYPQQRLTGIYLAHEMAKNLGDKMSPEDIVNYVVRLNNAIYTKILRVEK